MRLKYQFETIELDGNTVAVPVGEYAEEFHGVLRLNETAIFIFDLLKEEISEEAIVEAVEREFDAPREKIEKEVHEFVQEFHEKGLLIQ